MSAEMSTARPFLVKPEPSEKQVQEALSSLIEDRLGYFAEHLAEARAIYRQWPDLVTAPEFPKELVEPYKAEARSTCGLDDADPDAPSVDYGKPTISPEDLAQLRRKAKKLARHRMEVS